MDERVPIAVAMDNLFNSDFSQFKDSRDSKKIYITISGHFPTPKKAIQSSKDIMKLARVMSEKYGKEKKFELASSLMGPVCWNGDQPFFFDYELFSDCCAVIQFACINKKKLIRKNNKSHNDKKDGV
jgi:hypothetical protein